MLEKRVMAKSASRFFVVIIPFGVGGLGTKRRVESAARRSPAEARRRRSAQVTSDSRDRSATRAEECRAEQPSERVRAGQRRCGADCKRWHGSSIAEHVQIPGWRPDQHTDPVAPSCSGTTPCFQITRKIALAHKKFLR